MTALTLTPTDGAMLNLLDPDGVMLTRESADTLLPVPVFEEEYVESAVEGGRRVRSRPQNPTGSGRVKITGSSSAALWENVRLWQQTVERVRRDGGELAYTPPDGVEVTYDLDSCSITTLPQDVALIEQSLTVFSEFTFVCQPFGRLEPVTAAVEKTGNYITQLELDAAAVPGSVDAFGIVTVADSATKARDHVEYGFDPDYDAAKNAPILVEYDDFVLTGFEGVVASPGGVNVIEAELWTTPVVIAETVAYEHTRRWRVRARMFGVAILGPVYVRVSYVVGEGERTTNDWVRLPASDQWYDLDLGLVSLPKAVQGAQSWKARIEAYSGTVGDDVRMHYAELFPAYIYGKARAPHSVAAPTNYDVLDDFSTQAAGDLGTGTKAIYRAKDGGFWGSQGDTDKFQVDATNDCLTRAVTNDVAGEQNAHISPAGAFGLNNFNAIAVATEFKWSINSLLVRSGVTARYQVVNDMAVLYYEEFAGAGNGYLRLIKRVASTQTLIAQVKVGKIQPNTLYRIQLEIDADGNCFGHLAPAGAKLEAPQLVTQDDVLVTGAALGGGRVGIFDHALLSADGIRTYDNFAAWVPERHNVIGASKVMQVRHDAAISQNADGSTWHKVFHEGSYLHGIPPNRAGRLVIKVRETDIDTLPDRGVLDNTTFSMVVVPRVALLG